MKKIAQIFEVARILARASQEQCPGFEQDKQPTHPVRKNAKTKPYKQHPPPPKHQDHIP